MTHRTLPPSRFKNRPPTGDPRNFETHIPKARSNLSSSFTTGDIATDGTSGQLNKMSLPGLGLEEPEEQSTNLYNGGTAQAQTQAYELEKETEWRFEVAVGRSVTVRILGGRPEVFGTELVIGHSYTFASTKAAIFTWFGCKFDVTSDYGPLSSALTSEYVAEETPLHEYFNVHFALEQMRGVAASIGAEGPRTLIVGSENSGKTSVAKTITGCALRAGRCPMVVNLDPSEGVLSLPGTITATVFNTLIEVEEGWGNAPMSGPNGEIPVKLPLAYYYGSQLPEEKEGTIYKKQIQQIALAVAGKFGQESEVRTSGVIIDTPGSLVNNRASATGYDIISHIVSEFGINGILCLGSERLYSDLVKKFDQTPTSKANTVSVAGQESERIAVVKLTKSGGVADRDQIFMRAFRDAQVKTYFYGNPTIGAGITLQPRQQQVDFNSLTVWRRISSTGSGTSMAMLSGQDDEESFLPGDADEDEYVPKAASVPLPASQIFERLTTPLPALRNCVLAVMNCEPDPESGNEQDVLRDSSVMGFLYVTDVDEGRGRISLLSPVAGRVPNRALVWAEGIDGVLGLT